MSNNWYSVRCFFKHPDKDKLNKKNLYEERITVWEAASFEKAIELAEKEAQKYALNTGCKYSGFSQSYRIINKKQINSGSEIFSLMRKSDEPLQDYLNGYFDTEVKE